MEGGGRQVGGRVRWLWQGTGQQAQGPEHAAYWDKLPPLAAGRQARGGTLPGGDPQRAANEEGRRRGHQVLLQGQCGRTFTKCTSSVNVARGQILLHRRCKHGNVETKWKGHICRGRRRGH